MANVGIDVLTVCVCVIRSRFRLLQCHLGSVDLYARMFHTRVPVKNVNILQHHGTEVRELLSVLSKIDCSHFCIIDYYYYRMLEMLVT